MYVHISVFYLYIKIIIPAINEPKSFYIVCIAHNQFEVYFWLLFCHENYKFQMIWDRLLSKKKLCETFPVGKGNVNRMCLCQGLRTINTIKKTPECPTNASRMCGRNVYTRKREWEREWNELRSLSCECSSFSVCKYLLMPLSFVCSTALVW